MFKTCFPRYNKI